MRSVRTSAVVALLVGGLATAGPAAADVKSAGDPNDTSSPLDIRRIAHGHAGTGAVTHSISTYERFSSQLLGSGRGFTLQFDLNKSRNSFERFVFVGWQNGALRGLVVKGDRVVGRATVTRPNGRTVRIRIPKRLLGNPAEYRWLTLSFFQGGPCAPRCIDLAPNRGLVFHDVTPPKINLVSFPEVSTATSATTTVNVRFQVTLGALWRLQRRVAGASVWTVVRSNRGRGIRVQPTSLNIPGSEGETYEFRVVATDPGGTTRSPIRRVTVPVDDRNAAFSGAFSGTWHLGGGFDPFLATTTFSGTPGASFTHIFTGAYVGWVAPGGGGTASVTIDSDPLQFVDLSAFTGNRRIVFSRALPAGPHTIRIEVLSGPVTIDAIALR